jgi:hypothetical protein
MQRRSERVPRHERIHGAPPPTVPTTPSGRGVPDEPPSIRHCWVTDEHGRLPGLLLEWRRTVSGWQGRVVRPVFEEGCWVVVEEWLPAGFSSGADADDALKGYPDRQRKRPHMPMSVCDPQLDAARLEGQGHPLVLPPGDVHRPSTAVVGTSDHSDQTVWATKRLACHGPEFAGQQ